MLSRREVETALKAFVADARAKGMNVTVDRFGMGPDGVRVVFVTYAAGTHAAEGTLEADLPWSVLRQHLKLALH